MSRLSINRSEAKISDWNQKHIICENGGWIFSGSASDKSIYPKTMMMKNEELEENKTTKFKKIPKNEIEKLILSSIAEKPDSSIYEIIYDLDLPQLMFVLMMYRKNQIV